MASAGAASDNEILLLREQRSPRAIELLYDRCAEELFTIAHVVLHDAALAEEATMEAFLGFWRSTAVHRDGRNLNELMRVLVLQKARSCARSRHV